MNIPKIEVYFDYISRDLSLIPVDKVSLRLQRYLVDAVKPKIFSLGAPLATQETFTLIENLIVQELVALENMGYLRINNNEWDIWQ